MKLLYKLLLTTVVVSGQAINSLAQNNATTASASAAVITPITVVKNVDMSFGNMAVSPSTPGSVMLSPSGIRSTGGAGGVTLPATTGTVSPASFTVSGQGNYTFAITLPTSCIINDGSGNTMTGDAFTSNPVSTGILNISGTRILNIGATLNLSAGQHPGAYTNVSGLPITVNYN